LLTEQGVPLGKIISYKFGQIKTEDSDWYEHFDDV
jgi:hypothetical protein